MSAVRFSTAIRRAYRPLIALGGPSGSGKTYSGLLLARGLVGPTGEIFVIDTENRRSEMYAGDPAIGPFQVGQMFPPFRSASFAEVIDEAEKAKAACIVVDTMTHEWNGTGGCVEQAEDGTKAGPQNWIAPKRAHLRLMNRITLCQVPVIFTLRAKPKLLKGKDQNGRDTFAEGPMQCEQERQFIYEMTVAALLEYETNKAYYSRLKNLPKPLRGLLNDGELIGIETGRIIRDFVNGGAKINIEFERAKGLLQEAAADGMEAFKAAWSATAGPMQEGIKAEKGLIGSFKSAATQADALREERRLADAADSAPIISGGDGLGGPAPIAITPERAKELGKADAAAGKPCNPDAHNLPTGEVAVSYIRAWDGESDAPPAQNDAATADQDSEF